MAKNTFVAEVTLKGGEFPTIPSNWITQKMYNIVNKNGVSLIIKMELTSV